MKKIYYSFILLLIVAEALFGQDDSYYSTINTSSMILGNEIQTLINEYKTKGEYNYTFNGTSLANGVYIYTLTSGSFSQSKKMIIIK